MRKSSLTLAVVALIVLSAGADCAVAQGGSGDRDRQGLQSQAYGQRIHQPESSELLAVREALPGRAAMQGARAYPGGGATGLCRLFSSVGAAHVSQNADIGYKRPGVATDKTLPPAAKLAPKVSGISATRRLSPSRM